MKICVCIASYGTKNDVYLDSVLKEYRRMSFDLILSIISDRNKNLGSDVCVRVGLPTKDPHSLPFEHKKVFAENLNKFDLFIYSEDDILITEKNIKTFLSLVSILPENYIPGFMLYEVDAYGNKYCPDAESRYHWILDSVEEFNGKIFARFGNEHSAAYMVTNKQLRTAIDSGGYLVDPHQGDYDMECSAATDIYTQCGLRKFICVSHLQDVMLHHMPNRYIGRKGICIEEMQKQVQALLEIKVKDKSKLELFKTRKNLPLRHWDKHFYEEPDRDILKELNGSNKRILSVGAGCGMLEAEIKRYGHYVVAIPIDMVIAASLQYRNIETTEPDFVIALNKLRGEVFDCIVLSHILEHIESPEILIESLIKLTNKNSLIIIKIVNFNFFRWKSFNSGISKKDFLNTKKIRKWLFKNGFNVNIIAQGSERIECLYRLIGQTMTSHLARSFLIIAKR